MNGSGGTSRGHAAAPAYASRLGNWDRRASVRTKPLPVLDERAWTTVPFFPPELVPALAHPLVAERGAAAASRILVQALHTYLHFTVVLEQVAVMPVTTAVASGRDGADLPRAMRADAFKITTDEAWHAQFCFDFAGQVTDLTGVVPVMPADPSFVRGLAVVRDGVDPSLRSLVDVFFAIVSETLVSSLLSGIPNDTRLPDGVRALVADHAEDEGRHHAYFRTLLTWLWPQLTPGERRAMGTVVPDLVDAFLAPDAAAAALALADAGLPPAAVRRVVHDCYGTAGPRDPIATAAQATVRAFREVGALADAATRDAFEAHGLL